MKTSARLQPSVWQQTELPLTLSAADSHVRTFPTPEKARGLPVNGRDYGASTPVLLARLDPATSSWKTSQLCFVEGLATYSQTWPRSGLMRSGTAYQLPPLAPLTDATGLGLLPTPVKYDATPGGPGNHYKGIGWKAKHSPSSLWQTPVADDAMERQAGKWNSRGEPKLSAQVKMWPTPRACSAMSATFTETAISKAPQRAKRYGNLEEVLLILPTPTARDWRDNGRSPAELRRNSTTLATIANGSLNPTWVEWLMGFPLGWTDLKALETPSSRKSRK